MLVLRAEDVKKVLSMKDVLGVVEEAFRELGQARALMPTRQAMVISDKDGWFGVMPSYLPGLGALATKLVVVYPKNPEKHNLPTTSAVIVLSNPEDGQPICLMDGTYITAMRTGAVSGVASKYLAKQGSKVLGLLGAGAQARTQIMGVVEARPISKVKVYDVIESRARGLCEELGESLGLDMEVSPSPEHAVKDSDIICTVTTSKTPVLFANWLSSGVHVNGIGSHSPQSRELDGEVIRRSKLVVDQVSTALAEAGDILIPISEGIITKEHIYAELGELVTGAKKGRVSDEELTVFKSCGLAIQDASTASLAYKRAKESGLGFEVSL